MQWVLPAHLSSDWPHFQMLTGYTWPMAPVPQSEGSAEAELIKGLLYFQGKRRWCPETTVWAAGVDLRDNLRKKSPALGGWLSKPHMNSFLLVVSSQSWPGFTHFMHSCWPFPPWNIAVSIPHGERAGDSWSMFDFYPPRHGKLCSLRISSNTLESPSAIVICCRLQQPHLRKPSAHFHFPQNSKPCPSGALRKCVILGSRVSQ